METLDPLTVPLTSAWFAVLMLALVGPPAVALATVLLTALNRALGAWGGLIAWLTLALLAHLPLFAGPGAALATRTALNLAPLGLG